MLTRFAFGLVSLSVLAACSASETASQAPEIWAEYNEVEREYVLPRLTEIAATPEPDDAILFIGDSITQGADLSAMFPGYPVSNHGIAADRTQGVMARMEQITRGTPEKIFLAIGTNDLHQGGADPDAIAQRVGGILDTLKEAEPQADLHVLGIFPRALDMVDSVSAANDGIAAEAQRTGVTYIDLTPVLANADGKLRDELTYDDLHLTEAGYDVLADALRPCVETDCSDGYWSRVIPIGRYALRDGAMTLGWPGSGLNFKADGESLIRLRDSGDNQFDLIVNGESRIYQPEPGINTLTLEAQSAPYTVSLTRRSESYASGLTDILSVEGDVQRIEADKPRILFIGDSITAGFGTIGPDEHCGYSIETSSARDAYALMAAEELGADAHIVAISGRGVVYNWDNNPEPHMLGHFDLALPDTLIAWDHAQWTPDVVVVSLGTNDWSTRDPGDLFAANYANLLGRVSAQYPEAEIFAITGPMLTDERGESMQAGVEEAIDRAAKKGVEVTIVLLSLATEGHIYGCGYHPGPASNELMAEQLVTALKRGNQF